jgi:hypothetical protein
MAEHERPGDDSRDMTSSGPAPAGDARQDKCGCRGKGLAAAVHKGLAQGADSGGIGHGPAAPGGGHRAEHRDRNTGEREPANPTALARQTAPP